MPPAGAQGAAAERPVRRDRGRPARGIGGFFSQRELDRTYLLNGGAAGALEAEGFRAVRLLAEREGKSFFEGTK